MQWVLEEAVQHGAGLEAVRALYALARPPQEGLNLGAVMMLRQHGAAPAAQAWLLARATTRTTALQVVATDAGKHPDHRLLLALLPALDEAAFGPSCPKQRQGDHEESDAGAGGGPAAVAGSGTGGGWLPGPGEGQHPLTGEGAKWPDLAAHNLLLAACLSLNLRTARTAWRWAHRWLALLDNHTVGRSAAPPQQA